MCKKSYYLKIYKDALELSCDIIRIYGKTNKKHEKSFQYP